LGETAGAVSVSTISAGSVASKRPDYALNSGTLTMSGAASFNVDTGLTATISSAIAGTNTLWKLGVGTFDLG